MVLSVFISPIDSGSSVTLLFISVRSFSFFISRKDFGKVLKLVFSMIIEAILDSPILSGSSSRSQLLICSPAILGKLMIARDSFFICLNSGRLRRQYSIRLYKADFHSHPFQTRVRPRYPAFLPHPKKAATYFYHLPVPLYK